MGKFTFGPVPSRRLGFSLGVDIIPRKVCTFDCIYCQIGKTTDCGIQRKHFFDPAEIIDEVIRESRHMKHVDCITFSGSGEPTLNVDIGRMISGVKKRLNKPIAVITNGSLLYNKDVRKDLNAADIVLPSLDAATEEIFNYINKPNPLINLDKIIEGLKKFRKEYKGKIWLEVMLIKNLNDTEEELGELKKIVGYLGIDKLQLNTVTRPPAHTTTHGINMAALKKICKYFGDYCEVICKFEKKVKETKRKNWSGMVLDVLRRRSLTARDISRITGVSEEEVNNVLSIMETEGKIKSYYFDENKFYMNSED